MMIGKRDELNMAGMLEDPKYPEMKEVSSQKKTIWYEASEIVFKRLAASSWPFNSMSWSWLHVVDLEGLI